MKLSDRLSRTADRQRRKYAKAAATYAALEADLLAARRANDPGAARLAEWARGNRERCDRAAEREEPTPAALATLPLFGGEA